MEEARLIMLMGLPASGKSSWAHSARIVYPEYVVLSSDEIRRNLFGSGGYSQKEQRQVFSELHGRAIAALRNGQTVVYDATNIKRKRRMAFLEQIAKVPCRKELKCFVLPVEMLKERNVKREFVVPDEVYTRQLTSFDPPMFQEGWDDIELLMPPSVQSKDGMMDLRKIDGFDQRNPHHPYTLGEHCALTAWNCCPCDTKLFCAALYHDYGKLFTQSFDENGVAHYYGHDCCSSYYVLPHLLTGGHTVQYTLEVANLIRWHMRPFEWSKSPRAEERDKKFLGEEFYNSLRKLHEADVKACKREERDGI